MRPIQILTFLVIHVAVFLLALDPLGWLTRMAMRSEFHAGVMAGLLAVALGMYAAGIYGAWCKRRAARRGVPSFLG